MCIPPTGNRRTVGSGSFCCCCTSRRKFGCARNNPITYSFLWVAACVLRVYGINSLMKNFPEFDQKEIAIGCFGPATAKAVKDAGLRLDLEAPTVEAPSMTAALDMFIRERNKD